MPFEGVPCREVGRMRSAVAERHAKTLRAPDRHVRPKLPRWPKQSERQQIRRHRHQRACSMRLLDKTRVVVNLAVSVWVLHQRAENLRIELKRLVVPDDDFDSERLGASIDHPDRLRMTIRRDKKHITL